MDFYLGDLETHFAIMNNTIKFGSFTVTSQVFYKTRNSYALVNIKPILPGHIMVCPLRVVSRMSELSDEENIDLFQTVKKVSRAIETYYGAESLNIAIQDGPLAGQSVPHVHCHIIPRRLNDLPNVDDIYKKLHSSEGDLDHWYQLYKLSQQKKLLVPDDDDRRPRTAQEMAQEATRLREYMNNEILE